MGSLIVVTGPPGAGKSTVARLIADRFESSVLVEGDAFFAFLPPRGSARVSATGSSTMPPLGSCTSSSRLTVQRAARSSRVIDSTPMRSPAR